MMSIDELVGNLMTDGTLVDKLKMALVLDVSGSTGAKFSNTTLTVLEKEIECLRLDVLSQPKNIYQLYSFETNDHYHGYITVLEDEDIVMLPDFKDMGGTNTHLPLISICKKLGEFKPDIVRIYTDGQTNGRKENFDEINKIFSQNDISIEIVAISNSNDNLETIGHREEQNIPGMELVNYIGNGIKALTIYNQVHKTTPYAGIINSSTEKKGLRFLNKKLTDIIPVFINKLMTEIDNNKDNISWGQNNGDLKKLLLELSKLLSVSFVELNWSNPMISRIVNILSTLPTMTCDRVKKIIEYGFSCSKQKKPILMTNFEGHVKDAVDKKNEFSDANRELEIRGTTLGSKKRICIPNQYSPICILDNGMVNLPNNLETYPNSVDEHGNVYFGLECNPQAIRIAIRKHCGKIGFENSRYSNSVPFFVLCQMSIMTLKGHELNSEHMNALRSLAINQTSLEVVVGKNQYDGKGCYHHWKEGKLIAMHYTKANLTHTSIYTDRHVNPLGLSETLWWALMMSMLDLFEEQKIVYKESIEALGIECTRDSFLNYFRSTYESKVQGMIMCDIFNETKSSLFTLDSFDPNEKIYEYKDHCSPMSNEVNCCAKTWYSESELEYIKANGCAWCYKKPQEGDLLLVKPILKNDVNVIISNLMKQSSKLVFSRDMMTTQIIPTATASTAPTNSVKRFRINMCGITGSGKTTATQVFKKILSENNYSVLVVSADDLSKQGMKNAQMCAQIQRNVSSFEKDNKGNKVIIMDLCNERGTDVDAFGVSFHLYEDLIFYPNFDPSNFDNYEAWCLTNVLSRGACSSATPYYLNKINATLAVCINVHNKKASGIARITRSSRGHDIPSNLSESALQKLIGPKAKKYQEYLKTRDFNGEIFKFLVDSNILKTENISITQNETKTQI